MTPRPDIALAPIRISIVLCLGLPGCASKSVVPSHLSTQPPIVCYSQPSPATLKKIKIERISLTDEQVRELAALPNATAGFGSRWLVEQRPDTMRPGPWTTQLYIFDASATHQCVRVELSDHASYGVEHSWLNDKALFVRVWWGRIVSTDFVLDTDTMRFVYVEDANYFRLVYSQEKSSHR